MITQEYSLSLMHKWVLIKVHQSMNKKCFHNFQLTKYINKYESEGSIHIPISTSPLFNIAQWCKIDVGFVYQLLSHSNHSCIPFIHFLMFFILHNQLRTNLVTFMSISIQGLKLLVNVLNFFHFLHRLFKLIFQIENWTFLLENRSNDTFCLHASYVLLETNQFTHTMAPAQRKNTWYTLMQFQSPS